MLSNPTLNYINCTSNIQILHRTFIFKLFALLAKKGPHSYKAKKKSIVKNVKICLDTPIANYGELDTCVFKLTLLNAEPKYKSHCYYCFKMHEEKGLGSKTEWMFHMSLGFHQQLWRFHIWE
jgi:hypothetical protein